MAALCQFYGSVRSALGHVRSVLCQFYVCQFHVHLPPPVGTARAPAKKNITRDETPMSLQNSVCAHRAWCVQPPSPWWRCDASDRRSAFAREGKCASRRDARGRRRERRLLARPRSRSLSSTSRTNLVEPPAKNEELDNGSIAVF